MTNVDGGTPTAGPEWAPGPSVPPPWPAPVEKKRRPGLRILLIVVITLGACGVVAGGIGLVTAVVGITRSAQPTTYRSSDFDYTVTFPGHPKVSKRPEMAGGAPVTMTLAQVVRGTHIYQTSVTPFPSGMLPSNVDPVLTGGLSGAAGSIPGGTIAQQSFVKVGAERAIKGTVHTTSGHDYLIELFIHKDRLYGVLTDAETSAARESFLGSFTFTD